MRSFVSICILLLSAILTTDALALEDPSSLATKAGVEEHLGDTLPLELEFQSSTGEVVSLGSLIIKDRPIVIVPVYYSCPRLCGMILSGFTKLLNNIDLSIGSDFSVAAVSFNTKETSKNSAKAKTKYVELLKNQPNANQGWHFLTGDEQSVSKLMKAIGFNYQPDGIEFSHAAVFAVVTSQGVISRYIYGVDYNVRDVKFSLIEAAKGKIGQTFDKILLFCFRYDHIQGQYTLSILNIVRIVSISFVVFLFAFLLKLRWKERSNKNA